MRQFTKYPVVSHFYLSFPKKEPTPKADLGTDFCQRYLHADA